MSRLAPGIVTPYGLLREVESVVLDCAGEVQVLERREVALKDPDRLLSAALPDSEGRRATRVLVAIWAEFGI